MRTLLIVIVILLFLVPVACIGLQLTYLETEKNPYPSAGHQHTFSNSGLDADWHLVLDASLSRDFAEAESLLNYFESAYPGQTVYNVDEFKTRLEADRKAYINQRSEDLKAHGVGYDRSRTIAEMSAPSNESE